MNRAETRFKTFAEFWPFYLSEHSNASNRRLHFTGTLLVHVMLVAALLGGRYVLFASLPIIGYGFAWVGHFIVEKNRPATFKYPVWSLIGDFKLFYQMCRGRHWRSRDE